MLEVLESKASVHIKIPDAIYEQYQKQAEATKRDVNDVITDRLKSAVSQTGSRLLIFSDKERQELEKLLGGRIIGSPEAALQRIRQALRVSIEGVEVHLDANTLELIKSRQPRGTNLPDTIKSLVQSWVVRYLHGEL